MAFVISHVSIKGQQFWTYESNDERNVITVVTGSNGAGKTRLLAGLAAQYGNRRGDTAVWGNAHYGSKSEPTRVIVQTFSPFSRFPAERLKRISLENYLRPGIEKYVAIGFTRSVGLRGSVSKDAISRIARKVFTEPQQAEVLAAALLSLDFEPRLRLEYVRSTVASALDLGETDTAKLRASVVEFLTNLSERSSRSGEELRIARELESEPLDTLVDQLLNSIEALQELTSRQLDPRHRRVWSIDLTLDLNAWRYRQGLSGAITLARLGLLRVADCIVWPLPGAKWRAQMQDEDLQSGVSIMDASSGQQQLLSSLFGLVAELQDDSLVLLDEPELSLHPSWQARFLDLLIQVLSPFSGCHIFVATHSPLLTQRALELALPILALDDKRPLQPNRDSTVSVEQTLLDVFDLPVRESTYIGRLLLSLVMASERSIEASVSAVKKINELRALYQSAAIQDEKTLALIDDALSIIQSTSDNERAGRAE